MNLKLISIGASVVSLAGGAAGGYFFAKYRMDKKYARLLEVEIAATRAHYSRVYKKDEFETPESTAEVLGREVRIARPPVAVVNKLVDDLKYRTPSVVAVKPDEDAEGGVYIISVEQYMSGDAGYDQAALTYYVEDDVLADETDMPISSIDDAVGETNLDQFGRKSKDARMLYVRNDRDRIDYEIHRNEGSYAKIVHDVDTEIKHSVRRFRE